MHEIILDTKAGIYPISHIFKFMGDDVKGHNRAVHFEYDGQIVSTRKTKALKRFYYDTIQCVNCDSYGKYFKYKKTLV